MCCWNLCWFFCRWSHSFNIFWQEDCVTVLATCLGSSHWPLLVCKATQGKKLMKAWGHHGKVFTRKQEVKVNEEAVPHLNSCGTLGDNSSCRFYCCIFHEHINMRAWQLFFFRPLSRSRSWPRRRQCRVSSNLPSPSSQRGHNAEWAEHQRGRGIRFREVLKRRMVATTAADN